MCAIYGSRSDTMFEILHEATKERGAYAFSALILNPRKKKVHILQQPDHPKNIDVTLNINGRNLHKELGEDVLFLGHSQAPTSASREYSKETSHPFTAGDWIVAHNGVLTNYKEINSKYCPLNKNKVDTACIPHLLKNIEKDTTKERSEGEVVLEAMSLLRGTFALWIFNSYSGNVYILKQGSTLFMNPTTLDFCSIQSKGWDEVPEGVVYKISPKFEVIGNFTSTSPFLTL